MYSSAAKRVAACRRFASFTSRFFSRELSRFSSGGFSDPSFGVPSPTSAGVAGDAAGVSASAAGVGVAGEVGDLGDGGSAVAAAAGTPPPPPLVSSRRHRLCSSDLNAIGFEARASPRGGVPSAPPSLLSSMAGTESLAIRRAHACGGEGGGGWSG